MTQTVPRRRLIAIAVSAAALVVTIAGVPAARSDATTDSPTAQATAAERVARRFLDAYGAYQTRRALKYLTEEAIANGAGGAWGSPEAFRRDVRLSRAQGVKQILTGCEEQGVSATGTAVRCDFDLHAFHSDEIGRGPYTDNHWDLVVRDGKITSAVSTWAFLTNGFSAELWQPFQTWVASAHPLDLQVMYLGGNAAATEESIRLWEKRTREWAATVKASAE